MSSGVEEWRDVLGAEGIYEVSSHGRIRDAETGAQKPIPRYPGWYARVRLSKLDGRNVAVHRVVCAAFHGPPAKGQCALHGNGDIYDNRAANLRWGSHADNMRDRGDAGYKHKSTTPAVVRVMRLLLRYGMPAAQVADMCEVSFRTVDRIRRKDEMWRGA